MGKNMQKVLVNTLNNCLSCKYNKIVTALLLFVMSAAFFPTVFSDHHNSDSDYR